MDNQEIRDTIRRKANDIPVPASLEPDQIEKKIENTKQHRPFLTKRIQTIIATAASLAVICAAGFGLRPLFFGDDEYNSSSDSIVEQHTVAEDPEKNDTTYEEICDAINNHNSTALRMFEESSGYGYSGGAIPKGIMNDSEADMVAENSTAETQKSSSEDSTGSFYEAETGDYSKTDTQVDGVMEGDIVKTDGKHIFTIKDSTTGCTVTIYEAQGADVKELSHFTISQADCREMYIEGTTMILTGNLWGDDIPSPDDTDFEEYYSPARKTHITLYDISDPAAPKAIRQHSQSGEYNTSRISDGYLYTFTNYDIYASENYNEKEPEKFIPELNGTIMKSEDIRLLDKKGANSYMVMTSLNISDNGKFADSKAVLEEFDTYYMNQNHIYAVSLDYSLAPTRSMIIKYTYDKGIFSFKGSTKIRGEINDSYYMHEYKDNFVFVYTRDAKKTTNGLCVMDPDLNLMGEISDLGVNETIYASYFIDNMAYFVTYRNTDPVFAVDISDPTKPVLKSELKLPGFSSYLHSFGDDMLIGIGQEDQTSNDNDVEVLGERVKLSLFSIGKDYELQEIDKKLAAPDTTSYASTNHKSIFVDEERSLIGLGIDHEGTGGRDTYDIYQCRKGKLKKVLSVPLKTSTDIYYVRGLRIREYFYIADTMGGIEVYDINTWKKAK